MIVRELEKKGPNTAGLLGRDRLGEVAREVDIHAVHDGKVCNMVSLSD